MQQSCRGLVGSRAFPRGSPIMKFTFVRSVVGNRWVWRKSAGTAAGTRSTCSCHRRTAPVRRRTKLRGRPFPPPLGVTSCPRAGDLAEVLYQHVYPSGQCREVLVGELRSDCSCRPIAARWLARAHCVSVGSILVGLFC